YFIFGGSPWAVRLPAYIGGVLMIPAAYVAVRASNAPAAAIFTAALIAGSSILIEYSTNARGYTIMCLCCLITIAAARYAAASGNLAAWVVFVIASALGFYALPLMLYPFGTVLAWVVLVRPAVWRDTVVAAAATASIVLLLYLPVIAVSGWATILSNKYVAAHAWPEFIALTR